MLSMYKLDIFEQGELQDFRFTIFGGSNNMWFLNKHNINNSQLLQFNGKNIIGSGYNKKKLLETTSLVKTCSA